MEDFFSTFQHKLVSAPSFCLSVQLSTNMEESSGVGGWHHLPLNMCARAVGGHFSNSFISVWTGSWAQQSPFVSSPFYISNTYAHCKSKHLDANVQMHPCQRASNMLYRNNLHAVCLVTSSVLLLGRLEMKSAANWKISSCQS